MESRDEFDVLIKAFGIMSDITHAKDEKRRLELQNYELDNTCGSCNLWMTQQCNKEKLGSKQSCGMPKCNQFVKKWHSSELTNNNIERIKALDAFLLKHQSNS